MIKLPPLPTKSPMIDQMGLPTVAWVAWYNAVIKKLQDSESFALINSKFAASSTTSEYTVPNTNTAVITLFTATNTDSATRTVSVYLVPAGGSPSDSNLIINAQSVAAGVTASLTALTDQTLNEGDSIQVKASVASKVTIRCSGREVA